MLFMIGSGGGDDGDDDDGGGGDDDDDDGGGRSEEHTSELQSRLQLVFRLLLEKKRKIS